MDHTNTLREHTVYDLVLGIKHYDAVLLSRGKESTKVGVLDNSNGQNQLYFMEIRNFSLDGLTIRNANSHTLDGSPANGVKDRISFAFNQAGIEVAA